ncbi:glycoside hydrolase [Massarina eburnea CBS 473.64]|uniref:Beta-xylanase n=1 Tax=Massarina eburnea CBS 473.64 TaxID=1395130 RepID=A0A6A6RPE6_9PLEO|nr:glycoside hydrolase [Massarina eburnea CBS 473.64]
MKLSTIIPLLPLASATPTQQARPHPSLNKYPGLDILAKRAGLLYFGTAIDNVVLNNSAYISIAHNSSEFGQVTPSNGQKWMYIEPSRNNFSYSMADAIVKPAIRARQMRRCHTFVWHNQLPAWLEGGNWTKAELTGVLENHIRNEARYFGNGCYAWDVVNEAFEDDGSFRDSIWLRVLGKEYIELAFRFARKYVGRRVRLYYNDYGIERVNVKSKVVAAMVKDFIDRDIPIDGIGLQAHFTVGRAPTYDDVKAALNLFIPLGVETALTELDVRIQLPDSLEKQALQAQVYANSTKACMDVGDCVGVTVWDFWDPVSWVPETFPGYGNACLFDDGLKRKQAYYAVSDVLRDDGE